MKLGKFFILLSAATIAGFCIGVVPALQNITAQHYYQYKMFRLIALNLQAHLNNWILVSISVSICAYLIFWLLVTVTDFLGRKILKVKPAYLFCISCLLFFIMSAAAVNHYCNNVIPYQFLRYTAVFLLTSLLGLLVTSSVNTKIFTSIKTLVTATGLVLLLFVFFLNTGLIMSSTLNKTQRPNIVLIVIDCLRADHLGCYGYARKTSPIIDSLAKEGVLFKNAYSNAPWTQPSVATMFTSLHPHVHGIKNSASIMPKNILTLAEILKNDGYKTYFFNGGNEFLKKVFNFHQGFDIYTYRSYRSQNAFAVTKEFLQHVFVHAEPFFAYLHYMDAHTPYTPNEYNYLFAKYPNKNFQPGSEKLRSHNVRKLDNSQITSEDKNHIVSLYDGQIRFIDENIGILFSGLQRHNRLNNTVIIITADHGEEFWDHNSFEHGHSLYNELLRVPLIIVGKEITPAKIEQPARLLDVFPTILDLTETTIETWEYQGISLVPYIKQKRSLPSLPVFATGILYGTEKYCLIQHNQKLIQNSEEHLENEPLSAKKTPAHFEWYDLQCDPQEKINQTDSTPRRAVMQKDLEEIKNREQLFYRDESVVVVDRETKERLEALGYIGLNTPR